MIRKFMWRGFLHPVIDIQADKFGISQYIIFKTHGNRRMRRAYMFDATRNKNHGTTDRSTMAGNLLRKIKSAIQKFSRRVNR